MVLDGVLLDVMLMYGFALDSRKLIIIIIMIGLFAQ